MEMSAGRVNNGVLAPTELPLIAAWTFKANVCFHSDVDFGLTPGLPSPPIQMLMLAKRLTW